MKRIYSKGDLIVEGEAETSFQNKFPILIFHPTNGKMDFIKIRVKLSNEFCKIENARSLLRKLFSFKSVDYGEIVEKLVANFFNIKEIDIESLRYGTTSIIRI